MISSLSDQTCEDGAEVDEVAEAGPVPDKVELPGADSIAVAATPVEDGFLVEDSALRQGHDNDHRVLKSKMRCVLIGTSWAILKVATDTNILYLQTRYRTKLGWFFMF